MGCGASASQMEQPVGSASSWAKWRRRNKGKVHNVPDIPSTSGFAEKQLEFEKTVSAENDAATSCGETGSRPHSSEHGSEQIQDREESPVPEPQDRDESPVPEPQDEAGPAESAISHGNSIASIDGGSWSQKRSLHAEGDGPSQLKPQAFEDAPQPLGDAPSQLRPQAFEVPPRISHENIDCDSSPQSPNSNAEGNAHSRLTPQVFEVSPQTQQFFQVSPMSKNSSDESLMRSPSNASVQERSPKRTMETEKSFWPSGSPQSCEECLANVAEVFQDPSDLKWYCESCWADYYGVAPKDHVLPKKLVSIAPFRVWRCNALRKKWDADPVSSWPSAPPVAPAQLACARDTAGAMACVRVTVHPNVCGSHARETEGARRPRYQEILAERYQLGALVGEGHFTRAFLAKDITSDTHVCVKAHHHLKIENITDMFCIDQKLREVDSGAELFPRLIESFYDIHGYTVETLIEGQNCLELRRQQPDHFLDFRNVQIVARGVLKGLVLLSQVGVLHCDIKPDNVMWTHPKTPGGEPQVRLIDFGCSRLDERLHDYRNWSLAEGGAGHMGKWAPEMFLKLAITDRIDVWGLAVTLLELISKRAMWCVEEDTEEVILAQVLGLCNLRDGMPKELLQRSQIDVAMHYSPPPQCFPIRSLPNAGEPAQFEELRPMTWGLSPILGPDAEWDEITVDFASYVAASMTPVPEERPSAEELLRFRFLSLKH